MKRAFALLRVSSPEQSLESQLASLKKIAEAKGYKIPDDGRHVFQEKISGYDFKYEEDRKSIVELRAAINSNPPDAIFIWELSRLSRRATKVYRYIDEFSIRTKIPMYFQDFELWTFNPDTGEQDDRAINKLYGAAESVEREREMIIKRTSRGRTITAEKGLYVGHLADGYIAVLNERKEKEIRIDEGRVDVIKRIFEMYDGDGYSTYQIKDILNSEKVSSTNQYRLKNPFWNYKELYKDKSSEQHSRDTTPWTSGAISRILTNEWYIGKRQYKSITYPIPSIIDIKQWDRVQAKLKDSRILSASPNTKNFYLLQGLLYCGQCGRKMYGQKGGLNNHYYCSSKDSTKCGLRGISQDNADAIIHDMLLPRIMYDALSGADTIITRYLRFDDANKRQLEERIKSFQAIITVKEDEEEQEKAALKNYLRQQAHCKRGETKYDTLEELIQESNGSIVTIEKQIAEYRIKIKEIKDAIQKSESTIAMIQKVDNASLEEIRTIFQLVIKRIEVYNVDANITALKIKYTNDTVDYVLYSPRLMPVKFIPIFLEMPPLIHVDNLDDELRVITEHKLTISEELPIIYDAPNNVMRIRSDLAIISSRRKTMFVLKQDITTIKQQMESLGIMWDYHVYLDTIGVKEFVLKCREQGKRGVSLLRRYKRLEPLNEKALAQQERYRQWRKKYNTGLPTAEPYIVKDELYNKVKQERHKLYNRLYKIKINKSRTLEDKEQEVRAIKERLKELRYQIHYFGTSKNAKKYQR